jgi:hypothetical protein
MTSSISLSELQSSLQNYLLHQPNNADSITLETENFSKQERLGIYYDAYRLRLLEVLSNDFPALNLKLGDEVFTSLMEEYIERYPSHHPSLRWLGKSLPTFLSDHSIWKNHVNLIELAEFEWIQITAFDAENSSIATLDDLRSLQQTQWMDLKLGFQPALQITQCFSNAPDTWNALIKKQEQINSEISEEATSWITWRNDLQVMYRPLDPIESWCLLTFKNNGNFASVCEGLCQWFPEDQVPLKAAQFLQSWIQNGLVIEIIAGDLGVKNSV